MISAAEFERQKRCGKKILAIEEMPEWLAALFINGQMDSRHDHLRLKNDQASSRLVTHRHCEH